MRIRVLLVAVGVLAASAGAAHAEILKVACPTTAHATVSHNGGDAFYATPQASGIQGVSIERIGGNVALACHYQMFGGDYVIWRQPPASHPNCRTNPGDPTKFFCSP